MYGLNEHIEKHNAYNEIYSGNLQLYRSRAILKYDRSTTETRQRSPQVHRLSPLNCRLTECNRIIIISIFNSLHLTSVFLQCTKIYGWIFNVHVCVCVSVCVWIYISFLVYFDMSVVKLLSQSLTDLRQIIFG